MWSTSTSTASLGKRFAPFYRVFHHKTALKQNNILKKYRYGEI